jgi:hypothetical protein
MASPFVPLTLPVEMPSQYIQVRRLKCLRGTSAQHGCCTSKAQSGCSSTTEAHHFPPFMTQLCVSVCVCVCVSERERERESEREINPTSNTTCVTQPSWPPTSHIAQAVANPGSRKAGVRGFVPLTRQLHVSGWHTMPPGVGQSAHR